MRSNERCFILVNRRPANSRQHASGAQHGARSTSRSCSTLRVGSRLASPSTPSFTLPIQPASLPHHLLQKHCTFCLDNFFLENYVFVVGPCTFSTRNSFPPFPTQLQDARCNCPSDAPGSRQARP